VLSLQHQVAFLAANEILNVVSLPCDQHEAAFAEYHRIVLEAIMRSRQLQRLNPSTN
jgi:hypothetical protein